MIDISKFASGLEYRSGVWYAKGKHAISYPSDGNEKSFQLEEGSFWFNHRNACIVSLIKQYTPTGYVFDVGGGNGFVTKALEKEGIGSVLVEPGMDGIQHAKERNVQNIICATLEDANFASGSLPAVGAFDVLEHIDDDVKFLATIFRLLETNGKLYLTVPAYSFLWSNEDKLGGHFRRYTLKKLVIALQSVGYKIEYATYIFTFLPVPIFFFRTLSDLVGLGQKEIQVKNQRQIHKPLPSIFNKILDWEVNCIQTKKKIWSGGSCMVCCSKK
jgi:SAM-dependent methyltransferase